MKMRIIGIGILSCALIILAATTINLMVLEHDRGNEQEKLKALLVRYEDTLVSQQLRLRTAAYHQAVAELEQQYPDDFRKQFTSEDWEKMLADRQEQILINW